jgi:hypothetical protein
MGLAEKELASEVLGLDSSAVVGDARFVEAGLNERAERRGFLELMEELKHRLIEEAAEVECSNIIA